jgi:hypothetical protein
MISYEEYLKQLESGCLGVNYNPNPTRTWYRNENRCIYEINPINQEYIVQLKMHNKGYVLQHY